MQITVEWRKQSDGQSTVIISDELLDEYADGQPITPTLVKEFLDAGDSDEWSDQIRDSRDEIVGSQQYDVVGVEL